MNGTNQTVTASTWTKLAWSKVVFDTNSNFASNRYTPTVAGKYLITASMRCADNTSYCPVAIYKNGSEYQEGSLPATLAAPITSNATAIIDMNGSTDYVEAYGYDGGGTTISGYTELTNFSGAMLTP
jgi:hypothetical protein